MDTKSLEYINSTDYKVLEPKLRELLDVIEDNQNKSYSSRKLRYADVDVEAERETGRLQPDEMYIPQHIIDTNIRREQSSYVQFVTQSPRAVILEDQDQLGFDLSLLEKDLTKKLRFDNWQLPMFANIDGFQANGYSFVEVIQDSSAPGEITYETIQLGDFAFLSDTRDIQSVEMTFRAYYFTRTQLLALCGNTQEPKDSDFSREQVLKVVNSDSTTTGSLNIEETDTHDRSLWRIFKVMFRIGGVVQVAWSSPTICDDWLRLPRPLYIGRRKNAPQQPVGMVNLGAPQQPQQQGQVPPSSEDYETEYPYFLFPYLISENDTIAHLKGRVFLDQDTQEGITSLLSSAVTQARRASGLYGSKDVSDPNDDLMMQKNITLRSGSIMNSKINFTQLEAPDPAIFTAINTLGTLNSNETSQVNFAIANRKDSRKTAKEIGVAQQQATVLSTVQVVLFSLALRKLYTLMTSVIVSRVQAGLIIVPDNVRPLYNRRFMVKPSGDVDVIERQNLTQTMLQGWEIMSQTAASVPYLIKMIELMFPQDAPVYVAAIQQAQQQSQSQQAQMLQQGLQMVKQMAAGIVKLSEHPDFFSDVGKLHAFPIVEHYADEIKQVEEQMKASQHSQQNKGK